MNETNKDDLKIKRFENWKFSEPITLGYLLSTYHHLPICNFENNIVMNKKESKQIYQFQFRYVLGLELNIEKAFKEQIERNISKTFGSEKNMRIRKVWRKENTCVPSPLVFYENIKNVIFKALILAIYCIMDNYVCVDYPCCPKTRPHVHVANKGFENTT